MERVSTAMTPVVIRNIMHMDRRKRLLDRLGDRSALHVSTWGQGGDLVRTWVTVWLAWRS